MQNGGVDIFVLHAFLLHGGGDQPNHDEKHRDHHSGDDDQQHFVVVHGDNGQLGLEEALEIRAGDVQSHHRNGIANLALDGSRGLIKRQTRRQNVMREEMKLCAFPLGNDRNELPERNVNDGGGVLEVERRLAVTLVHGLRPLSGIAEMLNAAPVKLATVHLVPRVAGNIRGIVLLERVEVGRVEILCIAESRNKSSFELDFGDLEALRLLAVVQHEQILVEHLLVEELEMPVNSVMNVVVLDITSLAQLHPLPTAHRVSFLRPLNLLQTSQKPPEKRHSVRIGALAPSREEREGRGEVRLSVGGEEGNGLVPAVGRSEIVVVEDSVVHHAHVTRLALAHGAQVHHLRADHRLVLLRQQLQHHLQVRLRRLCGRAGEVRLDGEDVAALLQRAELHRKVDGVDGGRGEGGGGERGGVKRAVGQVEAEHLLAVDEERDAGAQAEVEGDDVDGLQRRQVQHRLEIVRCPPHRRNGIETRSGPGLLGRVDLREPLRGRLVAGNGVIPEGVVGADGAANGDGGPLLREARVEDALLERVAVLLHGEGGGEVALRGVVGEEEEEVAGREAVEEVLARAGEEEDGGADDAPGGGEEGDLHGEGRGGGLQGNGERGAGVDALLEGDGDGGGDRLVQQVHCGECEHSSKREFRPYQRDSRCRGSAPIPAGARA